MGIFVIKMHKIVLSCPRRIPVISLSFPKIIFRHRDMEIAFCPPPAFYPLPIHRRHSSVRRSRIWSRMGNVSRASTQSVYDGYYRIATENARLGRRHQKSWQRCASGSPRTVGRSVNQSSNQAKVRVLPILPDRIRGNTVSVWRMLICLTAILPVRNWARVSTPGRALRSNGKPMGRASGYLRSRRPQKLAASLHPLGSSCSTCTRRRGTAKQFL